jgi:hypothetical protein
MGLFDDGGAPRMNVFGAFAEDEDGIGAFLEDRAHGEDRGSAAMLEVVDERDVADEPLVPPPKGRGDA